MSTDRVTTDEWNRVYRKAQSLTEQRNAVAGIWDASAKVAWACRKTLEEYEGKINVDEAYIAQLRAMKASAEAKVSQIDPYIIELDRKIDHAISWLKDHEGVA